MAKRKQTGPVKPQPQQWPMFVKEVEQELDKLYADPDMMLLRENMPLMTTIAWVLSQRADVRESMRTMYNTDPKKIDPLLYDIDLEAHGDTLTDAIRSGRRIADYSEESREWYVAQWKRHIGRTTLMREAVGDHNPVTATENFISLLKCLPELGVVWDILQNNQQARSEKEQGAESEIHAGKVERRQPPKPSRPPQRKSKGRGKGGEGDDTAAMGR